MSQHTAFQNSDVSQLLLEWRGGDSDALEKLTPIIYQELRRQAHRYMRRERPGHLLQTTSLVHEAYLRLVGAEVEWKSRTHFFAVSAGLMRRILVDFARRRKAEKRGGGEILSLDDETVTLQLAHHGAPQALSDLVELDDALKGLAAFDERKSRIVELRYFGGLLPGHGALPAADRAPALRRRRLRGRGGPDRLRDRAGEAEPRRRAGATGAGRRPGHHRPDGSAQGAGPALQLGGPVVGGHTAPPRGAARPRPPRHVRLPDPQVRPPPSPSRRHGRRRRRDDEHTGGFLHLATEGGARPGPDPRRDGEPDPHLPRRPVSDLRPLRRQGRGDDGARDPRPRRPEDRDPRATTGASGRDDGRHGHSP